MGVLVAAALAAATFGSGCGSDGSVDGEAAQSYIPDANITMTAAHPPLTKAEFADRVNKICRTAWGVVVDNWAVHAKQQDQRLDQKERFDEAVRVSLLAGLDFHIFDDIRQLGSPPGQEEQVEAIIRPFQVAVELGWKERWHADSVGDVAAQFETYNQRAREYGLNDCVVDSPHLRRLPKLES